jgi:hypothetical protein
LALRTDLPPFFLEDALSITLSAPAGRASTRRTTAPTDRFKLEIAKGKTGNQPVREERSITETGVLLRAATTKGKRAVEIVADRRLNVASADVKAVALPPNTLDTSGEDHGVEVQGRHGVKQAVELGDNDCGIALARLFLLKTISGLCPINLSFGHS